MLKHWRSHADYQHFIAESFASFSHSFEKLTSLNLDPLADFLAPFYSTIGRPANNQPEIFCSIILMIDQQVLSVTNWVSLLQSDDLLALLIGCTPNSLPPLGSYYDFINRLWGRDVTLDHADQSKLYAFPKNSKPKQKAPSKNKKLPNKHRGVTRKIVDQFLASRSFSLRYEHVLQELFAFIAVVPSMNLSLISPDHVIVAGDGTCVHSHSSPLGNKVCQCKENGDFNCKCPRHYSDIDASYGWDSSLGTWFYGHTLYAFSTYDSATKTDLPLLFRFVSSKRHDSVTCVVALAELKEVLPSLPIKYVCFDSTNDNYPTYELCQALDYTPLINLNDTRGKPATLPPALKINDQGTPICPSNHEIVYCGFCKDWSRHKWRCPVACKKVEACTCENPCSPSAYGRVIYTKPDWDIRLFPTIPRGTKAWKSIYKTRTCSECINNRILNDYGLYTLCIHGKKRYSFFPMMIGITIYLDAHIKQAQLATA